MNGIGYKSGEYLERNPGWHEEDSAFKVRHVAAAIESQALPHQRICDIGCGVGAVISGLSERFPDSDLVGFEISPQAISIATVRGRGRNVTFIQGDGLQQRGFDIAMALDVFEHVEDYFGFLRAIKPVATYKIFHIPLDMSALAVAMDNPSFARREVGHLHYFSKETALATLRDCGYKVISHTFTDVHSTNMRNLFTGGRTIRKLAKIVVLGLPRFVLSRVSPSLSARLLGGLSLLVVAR